MKRAKNNRRGDILKLLKRLLLVIAILVVLVFGAYAVFVNRIHSEVNVSDLPQDVYENDGDLQTLAMEKLVEIFSPFSTEDDYTLFEDFLNLMILSIIRDDLNADYDPLADPATDATTYIYKEDFIAIDKIYAHTNESDQIVLTVAFENHTLLKIDSKIVLVFDVDIHTLPSPGVTMTLNSLFLSDIDISIETLDWILSHFDKTAIEDSVPYGELDLTDYTYTVSPTL